MRRKLFCILTVILLAVSVCFFASCGGCNGCSGCDGSELKSEIGVTLKGGGFKKGVKLIAEALKISEEDTQKALSLLPDEFMGYEESDVAVMDISVQSEGVKVQPSGKVRVSVPAPLEGVDEYVVFHVKDDDTAERLDCELKGGVVTFETDSFSKFIIGNKYGGEKVTIKACGPATNFNSVTVIPGERTIYSRKSEKDLKTGEEGVVYVKRGGIITLRMNPDYDLIFKGWFDSTDGATGKTPLSTYADFELTVTGTQVVTANFETNLKGAKGLAVFSGESGVPVANKDGRAADTVYIKTGNKSGIDLSALKIKAKMNYYKSDKFYFIDVLPEQYEVTGLDAIDYNKEGEYNVEFTAKKNETETLTAGIKVIVTERVGELSARTTVGGKFYVGDNDKELFDEKASLTIADKLTIKLTAVPDENFDFAGWYECLDCGVFGMKISDKAAYEFSRGSDLNVVAKFTIKPNASNARGVYQFHVYTGESNLPAGDNGSPKSLMCKPGEAKAQGVDLLKLDIRGLRRKAKPDADGNVYELVPLYWGDYDVVCKDLYTKEEIGFDFNKEGFYDIDYMMTNSYLGGGFVVYVSNKFAHLNYSFEGKGSIETLRSDDPILTESGKVAATSYFWLSDYRELYAQPAEGYSFIGWFRVDESGNREAEPFTTESKYTFVQRGEDERAIAVFIKTPSSITAYGDKLNDGVFTYNLTDKKEFTASDIMVKTDSGDVVSPADYKVDLSQIDYTKTGRYPVTVTYRYDESVTCEITVEVPDAVAYVRIDDIQNVSDCVIRKGDEIIVNSPDGKPLFVELGTKIKLTAEAGGIYKFEGWYTAKETGAEKVLYSDYATETFIITENVEIYAKFVEKEDVTLTAYAANEYGKIYKYVPDGNAESQDMIEITVKEGDKVKLSAGSSYSYSRFAGWFDGNDENAKLISEDELCEFTVNENMTVYARFELSFTVMARIEGGGEFVGEGITEEGVFYKDGLAENAEVTVEVKAKEGYRFIGWFISSDNVGYTAEKRLSDEPKYTFTVSEETGNVHLTALFRGEITELKLVDYTNDSGFYSDYNGNISAEYLLSKDYEFLAFPERVRLVGVSGDREEWLIEGIEYEIDSNIEYKGETGRVDTSKLCEYTVTYTYKANPELKATIKITVADMVLFNCWAYENGVVTENGEPVNFGNGRSVIKGTKITLTAVANEHSYFLGWYIDNVKISSEPTYTFTVNVNMGVEAKFKVGYERIELEGGDYSMIYENVMYKSVELGNVDTYFSPENITVTGYRHAGEENGRTLNIHIDYTIDYGGLNFNERGSYTVTYSVIGQPEIFAKLVVRVLGSGDYQYVHIVPREDMQINNEDSEGNPIAKFVIGSTPYALEELTLSAYGVGQQTITLTYGNDFTIDYGGLDYTKEGRYIVKFIPTARPELTRLLIIDVVAQ